MFALHRSRLRIPMVALLVLLGGILLARDGQARAGACSPALADGVDVVYVAVATNFPDALGVGPGAGVNAGPILLVPSDPPLPPTTEFEFARLDPKKVVIVGGTAVISEAMEDAIECVVPFATIERLAGANRYETNTLFTQSVYPVEGWVALNPAAFSSTNPDTDDVTAAATQAYNDSGGSLVASVALPHGATILEMVVSGFDGDGDDMMVTLGRFNPNGVGDTILSLTSSETPGNFTQATTAIVQATSELVDNSLYSYAIVVQTTNPDLFVRNVYIRYRLGTPGA